MLTIGLTGGIGSGKSTVAKRLAARGAHVVDADKLGHEIYLPGTVAFDRLIEAFGPDILSAAGTIDRSKLGARVFSNAGDLARLNAIVHPLMADEIERRIGGLRQTGERRPVVVEAAVLIEAGWDRLTDEVWVVTSPEDVAVERVIAERGLDRDQAKRRIASQIGDEARSRVAGACIPNGGSLAELEAEIDRVWRERVEKR